MTDLKTPESSSISKFMFRFTQDEVTEMENILKETNNANPTAEVFNALAIKFSKARHQQGLTYARYDSVQNWFRKRRYRIRKAAKKALSSERSTKPSDPSSAAEMEQSPMDDLNSDDEEASSKRTSEKEGSEGGFGEIASGHIVPDSSVSNSAEIADVDSVLARLSKFKRVQPEATQKSFLNQLTDAAHSSAIDAHDIILQPKSNLEIFARMTLVEFKRYQSDFDAAVSIIIEQGYLSDKEKTELLLLQERSLKIVKENELAREELSKCNAFIEKLTEAAENTNNITNKTDLLEEKYNKFPKERSLIYSKISRLETALTQAKGELEILKGDREDVSNKLAELRQSLESVSQHYKILKDEEASMTKKRAKIDERLMKNTEEWIQLTHSKVFSTKFNGRSS